MPLAPALRHHLRGVNDLFGVVAAGASQHGHAPRRLLDDDFDDPRTLGVGQRRAFAGRAARHEEVDAAVDLAAHQAAERGLVEGAAGGEGVTSAVPQPVQGVRVIGGLLCRESGQISCGGAEPQDVAHAEPAAAAVDPAGRRRVRHARTSNDRGPCASASRSRSGRRTRRCACRARGRPGWRPRRCRACSRRAASPPEARARFPTARRAWRRGALRESTRRSPARPSNRRADDSTSAWNSATPTEKFGAATTPMPASAAISRSRLSSACQPVVPTTDVHAEARPAAGSCRRTRRRSRSRSPRRPRPARTRRCQPRPRCSTRRGGRRPRAPYDALSASTRRPIRP